MSQPSPKHLRGCKDRGNAQQLQALPKAAPEATDNLVVWQSSALNAGWHLGNCAATERQHFSRSSLHPGTAHWHELRRVQERVSAELQLQADRISKVESSIDIGALQEAVDTAVSECVNERLGELVTRICALRADLQKALDVKRVPEVLATLQENTGQELFFRLEEAMEREKQSRLQFEDTVMSLLNGRCRICASQPHMLQELRARIQTAEEDLRAARCHLNLEKPVATLAATMRCLQEDCPLGFSPACSVSVSTMADVLGSNTSEVTTAAPESVRVLVTAETFTDSACRMDGRKSGGGRGSFRRAPILSLQDKHGKQHSGACDR